MWKIGVCDYFPCTVILWHSDVSVWHSFYGRKKNVHTPRGCSFNHIQPPLNFQMSVCWAILDLYCIRWSEVIKMKKYRILIDITWFLLYMRWIYELFLPFILGYTFTLLFCEIQGNPREPNIFKINITWLFFK
jgi:hypothetical protein